MTFERLLWTLEVGFFVVLVILVAILFRSLKPRQSEDEE